MSHTPGPWSWWTSNSYMRLTAEGKQDGGVLSAVSYVGFATVRVSDADARLIAAAPDLLAALRGLYANAHLISLKEDTAEDAGIKLAAILAIRKATGELA